MFYVRFMPYPSCGHRCVVTYISKYSA